LTEQLLGHVYRLSLDACGCRVIQKALTVVVKDLQAKIANELTGKVEECIQNMHGNHVIQKCVEQLPPDNVAFIVNHVEAKTEQLTKHSYGCRVIQRLLEHTRPEQLEHIYARIRASALELCTDNYGNYVVQHVLDHGRMEDKRALLHLIAHNFKQLARDKQASHVVEKSFEIATVGEHAPSLGKERAELMAAVLNDPSILEELLKHKYGNYIVQRMIEHSRGQDREALFRLLMHFRPMLQSDSTGIGKHILEALDKEPQLRS